MTDLQEYYQAEERQRQTVERINDLCLEAICSMERLEAKNAKLRELCIDLFDRLRDRDKHCGECRSQCEHDAWNFGDPKCVYAKRMRELGMSDWREELRVR